MHGNGGLPGFQKPYTAGNQQQDDRPTGEPGPAPRFSGCLIALTAIDPQLVQ